MLCAGICEELTIEFAWLYGIFVFSSTLFIYNFQRMYKMHVIGIVDIPQMNWLKRNRNYTLFLLLVSVIGSISSFLYLYRFVFPALLLIGISLILCLFYVVRYKGMNLRELPQVKIHLIALVWLIAAGFFPLMNSGNNRWIDWGFVLIHYFLLLAVTIPFDIRDLRFDSLGHRTIPQVIGVKGAKIISITSLYVYAGCLYWLKPELVVNPFYGILLLVTVALLWGVNNKRGEYYYSGAIEMVLFFVGFYYWWI
jgi:hypothetical protein